MQKNLVIVESPAKAKTIEKFLGQDYKVMSSFGHIRDLKKKELSIDMDTLVPTYEIPKEKAAVVSELKKSAKQAQKVWLASDEDREGEAISWHLCEVLGLNEEKTNRIVFHEITKSAIVSALEHPRHLNMDLVNAQQARRVLDRLVGFKLSPVLWRKIKPSLSAGRVQSVAVRLMVEREREIQDFQTTPFYNVNGIFAISNEDGSATEVKAQLSTKLKSPEEVAQFLLKCKDATFTVGNVVKKPSKRQPAPPFTTSTLQQEAARKLGFTVVKTMLVAQHLYESGLITYMRTDSVNLSSLCMNASKDEIVKLWGEEYSKTRQYTTHSKGAQEAHEAIRPTYMDKINIEEASPERRLYELIWKRTAACQMADAALEKTTAKITISNTSEQFVASGEVVKFDGFLKVYRESSDDDDNTESETSRLLPPLQEGMQLTRRGISATQRFTLAPPRYTEASLVHKMEELGIGRPSTYAPTISTIQQRGYVEIGDSTGKEREYTIDTLKGKLITQSIRTEMAGSEKGKLLPTDIGVVVNDFLVMYFPNIMDYNFTAKVEQDFDKIAEGEEKWTDMMKTFYEKFEPTVESASQSHEDHKVGERELGKDPNSGKPVFVKIGRFGPVVQIGTPEDEEKPRFSHLPKDKSIRTITLDEALELFKLPRPVGTFEEEPMTANAGRFGPYIMHKKKYYSITKEYDPLTITEADAIKLIEQKRQADIEKHVKNYPNDTKLEVLKGRYGFYLNYDGNNYRLPKDLQEDVLNLTYEQCMKVIESSEPTNRRKAKKPTEKKAAVKKPAAKKPAVKKVAAKKPAAKKPAAKKVAAKKIAVKKSTTTKATAMSPATAHKMTSRLAATAEVAAITMKSTKKSTDTDE